MVESMKTDPLSQDANNGDAQWLIQKQKGVSKTNTEVYSGVHLSENPLQLKLPLWR